MKAMSDLGRILITLGAVLLAAGLLVLLLGRLNLPLGRLPGDMTWRGRNWSISFPLATSILLSVALTLLLWLISHFRR
jgi:ribose/xylose/arabinose/galactoside ABC-type transport system permease subunit